MQLNKAFAVLIGLAIGGTLIAPAALASEPSTAKGKAGVPAAASGEAAKLLTTEQLVAALKFKKPPIPVHVGFEFLFKQGHIPGSVFVGEGRSPEGRAKIIEKIRSLPDDRMIVLYCGCCPWEDCPNIQPTYEEARFLKGKTIKLLKIPKNLESDWIKKGYPTTTSKSSSY